MEQPSQKPVPVGRATMSPSMKDARNYYAWIADQFRPWLGERVLDIGGGHGAHLEHVVRRGRFVTSLDLSADCVADMATRFAGSEFQALLGDITRPEQVRQLAEQRFDTVLCVNVLEHIESDALAVRGMAAILAPTGGKLFLLVPAHPALYGTPDSLAGHHRRYARSSLVALVHAAGLKVLRAYYINGLGAIPYFLNARVLKPRTLGGAVDAQLRVFDRYVVPILRRVERVVPMPFGQSLIVVAEAQCKP
jgi:SAM-dependent methyltransferase